MTFVAPPPLEGILVLDLSRVLAGPFATMMLADMGATVIKVEEPTRGDDTRGFGPPFVEGESTYYLSFNRNKRSIAIDMKTPEGRELVKKLALQADIVIENFRPGIADRMGLGYEALSKEKPSLIYVSVSGFGQTGPERERPGYDLMAQGMSGLMSVTGPQDGAPYKVGVSQADLVAGLYAVQGALLALLSRHRNDKGQHVDVCLLDGQVSLLSFLGTAYLNTGHEPTRQGNRHASIAPYQTYEAADGFFNVAVGNDRLFEEFAREIGEPDLAQDARFATNAERVANIEALNRILEPIFETKTVDQWIAQFDHARIPAGPIRTVKQALENEQTIAREMVTEIEHPTIGAVKLIGNPVKLSATPARMTLAPPLLGQHTEQVLRVVLGLKDEEIAALEQGEVVKQWVHPHEEAEPEAHAEAVHEVHEDAADEALAEPAQAHAEPAHEAHEEPAHAAHAESAHEAHAEPAHEAHAEPAHEAHAEPAHEAHAEPVHEAHAEPVHEAHAEPAHEAHAEPAHEAHAESAHEAPAEPAHEAHAEPAHEARAEPTAHGGAAADEAHPAAHGDAASDPAHPAANSEPASPLHPFPHADPPTHGEAQVHVDPVAPLDPAAPITAEKKAQAVEVSE